MILTRDTKVYRLETLMLAHMNKEMPFSFLNKFHEKLNFNSISSNQYFRSTYKLVNISDVKVNDYIIVPNIVNNIVYYKYSQVININTEKRISKQNFYDLILKTASDKNFVINDINQDLKFLTRTTTNFTYLCGQHIPPYTHLVHNGGFYLFNQIKHKSETKDFRAVEISGNFLDGIIIMKNQNTLFVK